MAISKTSNNPNNYSNPSEAAYKTSQGSVIDKVLGRNIQNIKKFSSLASESWQKFVASSGRALGTLWRTPEGNREPLNLFGTPRAPEQFIVQLGEHPHFKDNVEALNKALNA